MLVLQISRKKLEESRQRLGGFDDVAAARKREKLLGTAEYRLEHMRKRLSAQDAANLRRREEIEGLRRDKLQRELIVARLERQLDEVRAAMESQSRELREEAESRDNAQREIQSTQALMQRELKQFEEVRQVTGRPGGLLGSAHMYSGRRSKARLPP